MAGNGQDKMTPAFVKPYKHVLTLSEELLFGPGGPFDASGSNDQAQIRVNNRKAMDRLLYGSDGLTKQELAEKLSLSLPTVSAILQDMQRDDLLLTVSTPNPGAGRPPVRYLLDRLAHIFASVLIQDAFIRVCITDAFFAPLLEKRLELRYVDTIAYWQKVCTWLASLLNQMGIRRENIAGINFIVPGYVDPVRCVGRSSAEFPCAALDVKAMEAQLGTAVYLNNYYEAAAFALGMDSTDGNLSYVSVGADISTTVIAGRRIFRTQESIPGAAGHLTLVPNGRRCTCGKEGCVRTYCSTDVFEAIYGETVEEFVRKLPDGGMASTHIVFWHEYLNLLASFLANQYCMFRMPVYLGGRLAQCMGGAGELMERLVPEKLNMAGEKVLTVITNEEDLALMGGIKIVFHNYI